jgi:hypothetical protein
VLCHSELFSFDGNQRNLFSQDDQSAIKCLQRDIDGYLANLGVSKRDMPWWEFQANTGGAALLLPKTMFLDHFKMERNAYGIKDNIELVQNDHILGLVIGYLAEMFKTSKLAIKIRLTQLGCLPSKNQSGLLFMDKI